MGLVNTDICILRLVNTDICSVGLVNADICTVGLVNTDIYIVGLVNTDICIVGLLNTDICIVGLVNTNICIVGLVNSDIWIVGEYCSLCCGTADGDFDACGLLFIPLLFLRFTQIKVSLCRCKLFSAFKGTLLYTTAAFRMVQTYGDSSDC